MHKAEPNNVGGAFFVVDDATGKKIDDVYQFTAEPTEVRISIGFGGKAERAPKTIDQEGVMRFFDGTEERVTFKISTHPFG